MDAPRPVLEAPPPPPPVIEEEAVSEGSGEAFLTPSFKRKGAPPQAIASPGGLVRLENTHRAKNCSRTSAEARRAADDGPHARRLDRLRDGAEAAGHGPGADPRPPRRRRKQSCWRCVVKTEPGGPGPEADASAGDAPRAGARAGDPGAGGPDAPAHADADCSAHRPGRHHQGPAEARSNKLFFGPSLSKFFKP